MMTAQEIFDTVATHLFTQGKPALGPDGECLYRTKDGLKCAAGCLISDDEYNPNMEGTSAISINLPLFKNNINLIDDLQTLHDSIATANFANTPWVNTEEMRMALKQIAVENRVNHSIVNNLRFKDR